MILTLIEYENGALNKNSLETVMLARSLANQLVITSYSIHYTKLYDLMLRHGI